HVTGVQTCTLPIAATRGSPMPAPLPAAKVTWLTGRRNRRDHQRLISGTSHSPARTPADPPPAGVSCARELSGWLPDTHTGLGGPESHVDERRPLPGTFYLG